MIALTSREWIFSYGTGLSIAIIVWFSLTITGQPLFEENSGLISINFMQLYMLPLFFAYGILVGEILFDLSDKEIEKNDKIYLIELFMITILAFLRITVGIPISGHALIVSFYLLSKIITNKKIYWYISIRIDNSSKNINK
ncbi:MAG: hypothetical protein ACXACX_01610 [Candidatus Hodarchaeales archaeon]|jgi:hypothetical protein